MASRKEYYLRLSAVRKHMRAEKTPALYTSKPGDLLYLTGRDTGRLVVTQDNMFLWVRDLYARLHRSHYGRLPLTLLDVEDDCMRAFFRKRRFSRVGVGQVYHSTVRKLRKTCGRAVKASNALAKARAVKTRHEIRQLKAAAEIATAAAKKTRKLIEPGRSELSITAEIESFIRRKGSEAPPFSGGMLLASGPASADIHALPTDRRIKRGIVLVDVGGRLGGYYSDVSRTFCVGRPTKRERELMEFVGSLRDECIELCVPGVRAGEIFDHARKQIEEKRLKFYHSLGHGIGLEVHESPNVGPDSRDVLRENMVFTIEPGVYLPGKFGVRFEDTVLLTKKGARKIT